MAAPKKQINPDAPVVRRSKRRSTRDRILEEARVLFNQHGVQGTAVFKIAGELQMSPGNLTYHFRSKSDIVLDLSRKLRQEIEHAIYGLTPPLDPHEVIVHLEAVLRTLWNYRFLFNSAIHVSQMDDNLGDQVKALQITLCQILRKYFGATIKRGEMRRPARLDGVTLLAENILAIWLQWLRTENIAQPDRQELDNAALRSCLRHHYSLIDPYVSRAFARESWAEIERRYGRANETEADSEADSPA